MPCFKMKELQDFGLRFLVARGVPEKNARFISETAVRTEAFGVKTHGVAIFAYLDSLVPEKVDPAAEPVIVKEKNATVLIDCDRVFGQLGLRLAREIATSKAREHGIAMAAVRNGTWIAGMAGYLLPLAKEGFFAQLWAQTNTCKDCAPVGGIDAKFSTNPVALAFPTGNIPVLSDFSTATVSMGKVSQMAAADRKADDLIFLDKEGKPSDDPAVVKEGGSICFVGGLHYGHKGYGLSLWAEALTAMAGGDCNNPDLPSHQNFNLTVIDPEAFAGMDVYMKEMKRFTAHVKNSRLRPGFEAIRLPGEGMVQRYGDAEQNGIVLDDSMVEKLNDLASSAGIKGVCKS